ncbi:MAG: hypothetical protein IJY72_07825, partial [Akkermansia sp.]|nr:hypothetical protein [Akkermansia sp.]
NIFDTVRVNENFFIGRQWEGVEANGLPTPQFNILKRVVGFITATITTDNLKVNASALAKSPATDELTDSVRILNDEFDALIEQNSIPALIREFTRNAAVDGDGCLYTYWDADAETGQTAKGAIKTEVIENTRVFFGNPNDREVQSQPWIIIETREMVRSAKLRAKANGIGTWRNIAADSENKATDSAKLTDDKATVLLLLWRDEDDGKIYGYEFTKNSAIRESWCLDIKLYPISWLCWDFVHDSYHGQAMLTGLIPNQIFINKSYAMAMVSIMRTAFPKIIYDKTRIKNIDNRVGGAIGVPGGDLNNAVKVVDPAAISPQISQFIQLAVEETEQSLGATSVALGDTRPDNTSAIIALQRAASTPTEITKQNLYKSVEELFRIYLEFIIGFYGKRIIDIEPPAKVAEAMQFAGMTVPDEIQTEFDFGTLKDIPFNLKLEAGASSYYSEIAAMQTLDNLLMNKHISPVQYLERVPDGYVPGRRKLISELKRSEQMMMAQMQPSAPMPSGKITPESAPELPTGGGYSALQRKINETGTTEGLV